jgi:hypothetical protein
MKIPLGVHTIKLLRSDFFNLIPYTKMNIQALQHRYEILRNLKPGLINFIKTDIKGRKYIFAVNEDAQRLVKIEKHLTVRSCGDVDFIVITESNFLSIKKRLDNTKIKYSISDL